MNMNINEHIYTLLKSYLYFAICCLLLLLVINILWLIKDKNLPPGPLGLPFVGYLPFLGTEAYKTLHRLTEKYGPIYSLYLGPKLVIVLGSFNVVKEALSNNDIMDRPKNPPNHLMPNSTNFSVCNGRAWKEQRRFSIQLLRSFGMAKKKMEDIIIGEIQKLFFEIDKKGGKEVNLDALLYSSVSNIIISFLIGRPLNYNDEDRLFLNKMLQTMTLFYRPTRIHAYFPWLRKWMARWKIWGYDQAESFMNKLSSYIEAQIEEHEHNINERESSNYIEGYLKTMEFMKETETYFSKNMLKGNFQSLFSAGSTPSRAALEWSLLSMIQYPTIQENVHQELDSVIDTETSVTWSDHCKLPYTLGVIYEAMRQNTVVPISMLRCTSAKTRIAGYDIPKDAIIMTNIWGVHHNNEDWDDPFDFKPERFIRNGKNFKPQEFIPFSFGKRNCPGEDMGIMTVFLYFANMLLRYNISFYDKSCKEVKQVFGVASLVILDNIELIRRK